MAAALATGLRAADVVAPQASQEAPQGLLDLLRTVPLPDGVDAAAGLPGEVVHAAMEDDDFDAVEALETELRQAREATGEKTAEEASVAPSEKSGAGMLAEVDAAGGGASGDTSASLSSSAEAGDTKPPTQSKPASTWEPKGTRGLSLADVARVLEAREGVSGIAEKASRKKA